MTEEGGGRENLNRILDSLKGYIFENSSIGVGNERKSPRMSILLSGPPGSGKTEFVKYIGHVLKKHVITKMGSDILSKWVGGTEENIRDAFKSAETEQSILFFDEIDGILQTRERSRAFWEVSQVNEMLYQMEKFNGILVAATNFVKSLDSAVMRRFTFKVEFDFLDNDGKVSFFKRFFNRALTDEQLKRLKSIKNLAPGDYKTVSNELYYYEFKDDENPCDIIIDSLEHESKAKEWSSFASKSKIGFKSTANCFDEHK